MSGFFFHFQDGEEKQFIFRHARQIFDLIDEDGSGNNHSSAIKLIIVFRLLNLSGNDFYQKFDFTFCGGNLFPTGKELKLYLTRAVLCSVSAISTGHNGKNWNTEHKRNQKRLSPSTNSTNSALSTEM